MLDKGSTIDAETDVAEPSKPHAMKSDRYAYLMPRIQMSTCAASNGFQQHYSRNEHRMCSAQRLSSAAASASQQRCQKANDLARAAVGCNDGFGGLAAVARLLRVCAPLRHGTTRHDGRSVGATSRTQSRRHDGRSAEPHPHAITLARRTFGGITPRTRSRPARRAIRTTRLRITPAQRAFRITGLRTTAAPRASRTTGRRTTPA